MNTIAQVAQAIQTILGPVSDQVANRTGFCQRSSKLTGSVFMQSMVFSGLGNAEWHYSDLVASALNAGVQVTKQGLAQRFTPASATFARQVLEVAVGTVIQSGRSVFGLLGRFKGVYIRDSSLISLPKELEAAWPGGGSSHGSAAGMKLHVRLEVSRGELAGPILAAGREHDQSSPYQSEPLPPGALRMGDLGFYSLKQFATDTQQGIYWLSRLKQNTWIGDEQGQPLDLLAWLRQQTASQFERPIQLGKEQRLACRLLVDRVPPTVVEQRKRKLHEYARKQQVALTATMLALCEWTLIVTNIPQALLSVPEALVLFRLRWQIELLFKRWKTLFQIDQWTSVNIWRILTELFAKLLCVVIDQWIQLTCMPLLPHPSFWKAVLVVRKFATLLALSFASLTLLEHALSLIGLHIQAHCHLDHRKSRPSLFQLLENPRVQP